jgi:hypothetical protein
MSSRNASNVFCIIDVAENGVVGASFVTGGD